MTNSDEDGIDIDVVVNFNPVANIVGTSSEAAGGNASSKSKNETDTKIDQKAVSDSKSDSKAKSKSDSKAKSKAKSKSKTEGGGDFSPGPDSPPGQDGKDKSSKTGILRGLIPGKKENGT